MNTQPNFINNLWNGFAWLLAGLPLAPMVSASAETPPAAIPFAEVGARATANYQGDALGVRATADGARLRCGFQKLEGYATREGLWLESTKTGATGKLRLVATTLCREGGLTADSQPWTTLPATGTVSVQDNLVRYTRPGLTEEYSASVDGVRQDFVIVAPPAGAGDLRVELALSGARAEAVACGARFTLEASGRKLAYSRLRVEDATGRELTACLEVLASDRLAVTVADGNAAYPVRIDPTFSDADWVSLNPGLPGANGLVRAIAADGSGNVYVGGDFTFIGTVFATYIAKWDGSAWSALDSGMNAGVHALAVSGTNLYAGGAFTTAGGVPANRIAKWNGSVWSALGSGMNDLVKALAVSETNLYAGGKFTTAGGVTAVRIAKWNGTAWSALGSGVGSSSGWVDPCVFALAVSGTNVYAGGEFDRAGSLGIKYIAKWNGSAWSALGSGMSSTVRALALSGTDLYAGGSFATAGRVTVNGIAKWDGSAWSVLGSGMGGLGTAPSPSVCVLLVNGTNLYVGGYFTTGGGVTANCIAKWDGSTWSALGSGIGGVGYPSVYALAVTGTNLYAGGEFTTAGTAAATYLAKWDASSWSSLGSPWGIGGVPRSDLYSQITALVVSDTDLYAGGTFTTAGGGTANSIAKWDGSIWSALGSGMGGGAPYFGRVNALAVSGTNLYVGGQFTTAGGVPATNIAKWDGSTWSALGSGITGGDYPAVYALAVSGTNLYAGGTFTTVGGAPANSIAKWDGSTWSALGSGMNGGGVYALAVSGASLYAGGGFYTAGGEGANYIAKWNGNAWSALGSGLGGFVFALAVSGPNFYAGGSFRTAGGLPATNIAKWYGAEWSALGTGMNGEVNALVVSGTNLYAGGGFTTAGGVTAKRIATWNGRAWSPLGSGMDGGVSGLVADGAGHLFVGGTFYLAGNNLSPYIAQANLGNALTNAPPVIFASPASLAVPVGATADFQVAAVGSPLLAYQWAFNGTNAIEGATSEVLSLANVQLTQAGAYSVTVSNYYGAATSAPAMLTITGVAPVIVASPASVTVASGATADFQVAATGSPPLVYQWIFNGTNPIDGATSSVLSLANVKLTQAGAYSAIVSNLYGAVTSGPAWLEVFPSGIVVTNSEANLRAVMALGGTVTFAFDGTIFLSSTITNVSDTTLDGSGHQITISGNNAVRVFSVNTNVNFTVVDLTIADARSSGGSALLNLGGTVNLSSVLLRSNTATITDVGTQLPPQGSGGAIFNRDGAVNANNCSFVGNSAQIPLAYTALFHEQVYGGAIHNESGQVNLRSCAFVSNRASGGAGFYDWQAQRGDPAFGGAIYNSGTMTVDLCSFASNSATGGKGLGDVSGYPGYSASEGSGGAIFNQGTLIVDRTTLCGNSATGGAGGAGGGPISGSGALDGYPGGDGAVASGGAIRNVGSLWVTRSTLVSNVVTGGIGGRGGGGWPFQHEWGGNGDDGGNGSSGLGGALFNSGAASLVNCTIAFNTGSGGAGGAGGVGASGGHWGGSGGDGGNGGSGFGGVDGTCDLTNCTIAWNRGSGGSGGIGGDGGLSAERPGAPGTNGTTGSAWGGTVCTTLVNTLIASNTPPGGGDTFTDPKLGPLANNGGPTLTMALLPGSLAIDAGDTTAAPPTDQRGISRPFGAAADIGAYEYATLLSISRAPGNGLDIFLRDGTPGQTCRLLTSTNFSDWTCVATNQVGANGTFLFQNSCDTAETQRLYKAVLP